MLLSLFVCVCVCVCACLCVCVIAVQLIYNLIICQFINTAGSLFVFMHRCVCFSLSLFVCVCVLNFCTVHVQMLMYQWQEEMNVTCPFLAFVDGHVCVLCGYVRVCMCVGVCVCWFVCVCVCVCVAFVH